jgi:hypothetical protein
MLEIPLDFISNREVEPEIGRANLLVSRIIIIWHGVVIKGSTLFGSANLLVSLIMMFAIIDPKAASSPEISIRGSPGGSPSQIDRIEILDLLHIMNLLENWRRKQ